MLVLEEPVRLSSTGKSGLRQFGFAYPLSSKKRASGGRKQLCCHRRFVTCEASLSYNSATEPGELSLVATCVCFLLFCQPSCKPHAQVKSRRYGVVLAAWYTCLCKLIVNYLRIMIVYTVVKQTERTPRTSLRLAIPSKGRMAEDTLALLAVSTMSFMFSGINMICNAHFQH